MVKWVCVNPFDPVIVDVIAVKYTLSFYLSNVDWQLIIVGTSIENTGNNDLMVTLLSIDIHNTA